MSGRDLVEQREGNRRAEGEGVEEMADERFWI